ncbi:MAG: hypothetical protein H0U23_02790 [Blastocatellia bacterium]|nr:hypothetical protein [Blastocatellia bacterium]
MNREIPFGRLAHANLWQVTDGNPISPDGYFNEYRDLYDPMGGGLEGSDYNPWFKYMLGWIAESQVKTITSTGVYRVYNFDSAEAKGVLALKVVKDAEKDYWISCRRNIDTSTGIYENPTIESGAYVIWGYHDGLCRDAFQFGCTDLLDMNTPGTSVDDAALAVGQRFYDAEAGVAFTVLKNGGELPSAYMDVYVEIGASPTPSSSRTLNLSTRASVQTGDDVMIGGFIVDGAAEKKLLIRAIGPSLQQADLVGFLTDPVLELHEGAQVLATNDDWRFGGQEAEIVESGIAPTDNRESAIIVTLNPGSYTTIVRGKEGSSGLGLVEVFDLDQEPASTLANISTRARVQIGDGAVIGGFILGGSTAPSEVVVRGVGPLVACRIQAS